MIVLRYGRLELKERWCWELSLYRWYWEPWGKGRISCLVLSWEELQIFLLVREEKRVYMERIQDLSCHGGRERNSANLIYQSGSYWWSCVGHLSVSFQICFCPFLPFFVLQKADLYGWRHPGFFAFWLHVVFSQWRYSWQEIGQWKEKEIRVFIPFPLPCVAAVYGKTAYLYL